MPRLELLLQGVTEETHAQALQRLLARPGIERVVMSVAFVSEGGVRMAEAALRPHAAVTQAFAGVRNDVTSYQGLVRLHALLGAGLHTVDTGRRRVVYHPKLVLARAGRWTGLLVGSANLTGGGMHDNIEAGVLLELENGEADALEARLLGLPAEFPENVRAVGGVGDLDRLLAEGLVIDERVRRANEAGRPETGERVPPMRLRTPARPMRRRVAARLELVWESKPLTRRDLTIPGAEGTHATGSMNLDKGLLDADVDHRHYFRDEVFAGLSWRPRTGTVEEAVARVALRLKGVDAGIFEVAISHTTSTASAAYRQRNAMTRLRWGAMRDWIAREDLIGRTLSLYRVADGGAGFRIEID